MPFSSQILINFLISDSYTNPSNIRVYSSVLGYINMSLKEFQVESKLGEGSFSSVYRVKRIADGLEYAMKKVRMVNLSEKERQNALNEVRILASINHVNIIGYKEAFIDDASDSLIVIMEYASEGDLFGRVAHLIKHKQQLEEMQIWRMFVQIVRGLKVLHGLNIQHRDLKSANIFLDKNGVVKIGDLNVSKISAGLCRTQTGTPYYASPEVWKDQPYDAKSDIWSLGCILYEMITLKPPFRAQDMEGLYKKVIRGFYEKIPSSYSQELANLVRMTLQVIPQLRPDCDKLLNQAYLNHQQFATKSELSEIKDSENTLLETIKIPSNIRLLSEKLPKPNYSTLFLLDKAKKSESRNSCPKNPLFPVIIKAEEPRKKRYISERRQIKPNSVAACSSEQQITISKNLQPKQPKQPKKNPIVHPKPLYQLPHIAQSESSPKPKHKKKTSIKAIKSE